MVRWFPPKKIRNPIREKRGGRQPAKEPIENVGGNQLGRLTTMVVTKDRKTYRQCH